MCASHHLGHHDTPLVMCVCWDCLEVAVEEATSWCHAHFPSDFTDTCNCWAQLGPLGAARLRRRRSSECLCAQRPMAQPHLHNPPATQCCQDAAGDTPLAVSRRFTATEPVAALGCAGVHPVATSDFRGARRRDAGDGSSAGGGAAVPAGRLDCSRPRARHVPWRAGGAGAGWPRRHGADGPLEAAATRLH